MSLGIDSAGCVSGKSTVVLSDLDRIIEGMSEVLLGELDVKKRKRKQRKGKK